MLPDTNKEYRDKMELEAEFKTVIRNESNRILQLLKAQGVPSRKLVGVMVTGRDTDKQRPQQEQKSDVFNYDKVLVPTNDERFVLFRINVPGLKFPIGKKDLMNLSRADFKIADFGILYHVAQSLPDKIFKDKEELEKDLVKAFNDDMRIAGMTKRITGCIIINDEKSRMDAAQFLEEQRMKKKTVSQTKS
jgi:hypothetical protein